VLSEHARLALSRIARKSSSGMMPSEITGHAQVPTETLYELLAVFLNVMIIRLSSRLRLSHAHVSFSDTI
jgi:hypothetical protein